MNPIPKHVEIAVGYGYQPGVVSDIAVDTMPQVLDENAIRLIINAKNSLAGGLKSARQWAVIRGSGNSLGGEE